MFLLVLMPSKAVGFVIPSWSTSSTLASVTSSMVGSRVLSKWYRGSVMFGVNLLGLSHSLTGGLPVHSEGFTISIVMRPGALGSVSVSFF